jgi:hypothetical protein
MYLPNATSVGARLCVETAIEKINGTATAAPSPR